MRRAACVIPAFAILSACSQRGTTVTAGEVSGGNAINGRHLIYAYGCGTCHVVPGISDASGSAGPPLQGFASRTYVAGVLQNTPENVVRWIATPQEATPGTAMPDLGVTKEQAHDIAAYLYTLR